jgi:hypothetical protein
MVMMPWAAPVQVSQTASDIANTNHDCTGAFSRLQPEWRISGWPASGQSKRLPGKFWPNSAWGIYVYYGSNVQFSVSCRSRRPDQRVDAVDQGDGARQEAAIIVDQHQAPP